MSAAPAAGRGHLPAPGRQGGVGGCGAGAAAGRRLRLVAFPHAGAGPSAYQGWGGRLGPEVDVVAIRLPGREDRFGESPVCTVPAMLAAAEPQWLAACVPPYAVFGHSVGALAAFELVRELRRRRLPLPVHLIVSGRVAPPVPGPPRRLHELPDGELVATLGALGGTPPAVLDDPALRALLLPILRADLRCDERYEYRPEPPLPVPLTVLGGMQDSRAPWPDLARWNEQTTAPCLIHLIPGGHFFVSERRAEVLAYVRAALTSRVG